MHAPIELYREKYWEIYDPNEARVIAHVFDKKQAKRIQKYVNLLVKYSK